MLTTIRPRKQLLLASSAVLLISLFKLILVGTDEMVALPYDSIGYANLISYFYFGAPNDWWRPSLFPLIGSGFYLLGIPYRIGIELIYLTSSGFITWALFNLTDSLVLGLLGFTLAALHPYTFTYFRYLLPEPLFCSLLLLFFGIALLLFSSRNGTKLSLLALLGVAGACLSLVRLESPIVLGFLLVFGLLYLLKTYLYDRARFRSSALATILPFLCFYAVITSARTANYLRWGTFNIAGLESGLETLLTTLYSIKVPDSVQHNPVTSTALDIAFDLSPSFRSLKPWLIDPKSPGYRLGEIYTHRKGEFGPQLNIALLTAAMKAAGSSQQEADTLLAKAAAEIATGLQKRHIPTHFVVMYPLDPNYHNWLPDFFRELPVWFALSIVPPLYSERPEDGTPADALENAELVAAWRPLTPSEIRLFDLVLNRRTSLVDVDGSKTAKREAVRRKLSADVLRFISRHYAYFAAMSVVLFPIVGVRWRALRPMSASRDLLCAFSFMIVCLCIRTAVYTMITAAAYPSQPRYVTLESPSFLFAGLIAVSLIFHTLTRASSRIRRRLANRTGDLAAGA
jgi:hypothetical protein